jgi:hypothetical protein
MRANLDSTVQACIHTSTALTTSPGRATKNE